MLSPQQIQEARQRLGTPPTREITPTASSWDSIVFPGEEPQQIREDKLEIPGTDVITGFAKGMGKGALSTLKGAASLGERILQAPFKALGAEFSEKTGAEELIPEEVTEAKTTPEKVGKFVEQIGEFFIPGGASVKLGKAVSKGIKAPKAAKVAEIATRAGAEAGLIGGISSIQRGQIDNESKTAALVGAAFPVAGSVLGAIGRGTKGLVGRTGEKILTSVIKPTTRDIKDGFKIANVTKYGVGGSLEETVAKTHTKINDLVSSLDKALTKSEKTINLNKVFDDTVKKLGLSKKSFGDIQSIERIKNNLKGEIELVSGKNGIVNLVDATNIKRGAGAKGAWSFNNPDPNASAIEKVYTAFYRQLKESIEKASTGNIKEINKAISDLIPISNAALRRLPVEQRNNVLSLTDSVGLFASVFDPRALALIGASKLSKSGKIGNLLANVGREGAGAKTTAGQRIFGAKDEVTKLADDLKKIKPGLTIEDITRSGLPKEDLNIMLKFIDNVRLKGGENVELEKQARYLAEGLGISPEMTNIKLANRFVKFLEELK